MSIQHNGQPQNEVAPLMISYALAYASGVVKDASGQKRPLYVFPVHVPIFDNDGNCTGCTCESYYRSEQCRDNPKTAHKYDPNFKCDRPGKCPSVRWAEKSTADEKTIRKWWGKPWRGVNVETGETFRYFPNIGIDCGKSEILVFDADYYKEVGGDVLDLLPLADQETPTQQTGGGGEHLIFDAKGKPYGNSTTGLPAGFDIRGKGGYIVAAPSAHKSGDRYDWLEGYKPREISLLPIPEKLDRALAAAHCGQWADGDGALSSDELNAHAQLIETVIERADLPATQAIDYLGDGRKWILTSCPFMPDDDPHADDGAAFILLLPDGRIAAGCSHNRCQKTVEDAQTTGWYFLRSLAGMETEPEITNDAPSPAADDFHFEIKPQKIEYAPVKVSYKRPVIQRNNRQMAELTDQSVMMITRLNEADPIEPVAYIKDGLPVRITKDETGRYSLQAYDKDRMLQLLASEADWITITGSGDKEKINSVFPPPSLAANILATPDLNWPPLRGVVHSPRYTKDGSLHTAFGYNAATRMFYGGKFDIGDTEPTTENVVQAKALIDLMLCDFPFTDDASRSHAWALLLTPFVRDMIDGPIPLCIINASTPGTGKTLLANVLTYPSAGRWLPASTLPQDEAEIRKKITGLILSGVDHVILDNVAHHLHSESLNVIATSRVWEDRRLGVNEQITGEVRAVFVLTGNNVSIHDESLRRTFWININAHMERPEQRSDFQIGNIQEWVTDNSDAIVTACLTLINYWVAQGMPKGKARRGSYEEWTPIIGGILDTLGIAGFLENTHEVQQMNSGSEIDAIREFVAAWIADYGQNSTASADLFRLAARGDGNPLGLTYRGLLADFINGRDEAGQRRSFGRKLAGYKDRVFNIDGVRYQIIWGGRSGGDTWYSIKCLDQAQAFDPLEGIDL